MTGFLFNIDGGYLEGLCRGFKCGVLKQSDYLNLVQCETLEGKMKHFCLSANETYFQINTNVAHDRIIRDDVQSFLMMKGKNIIRSIES